MSLTLPLHSAVDLAPEYLAIVCAILKQHVPDREIWAFGSRVLGKAKAYSDLDVVVVGEAPLTLATRAALIEAFDESDLPIRVDVVDWAQTSERFRAIILRDKVVLRHKHQ